MFVFSTVETRHTDPEEIFITRVVECSATVAQIITLPAYAWSVFDRFCAEYRGFREKVLAVCAEFSRESYQAYSCSDIVYNQIFAQIKLNEAVENAPDVRYRLLFNRCASPF